MKQENLIAARKEFELFMRKQRPCMSLEKNGGCYTDENVERLWQTWIAVHL